MASIWDPAAGGATVNANNTLQRQRFTAAEGQTDFTLTEFSYVPNTGSTIVFYNGAAQQLPTDYTELSASVIKLNFACNLGDLVDVIGFTGVSAVVENIRLFNNTVIATAGQTEISTAVAYRAGTSSTALYENGVRLIPGVDYTETDNASFLTLTTPATGGETYFSVVGQLVNDVGSDAALISYTASGVGAVASTVEKKLRNEIKSVFDYMTDAEIADVQARTNSISVLDAILKAFNETNRVIFPDGSYYLGQVSGGQNLIDLSANGENIEIICGSSVKITCETTDNSITRCFYLKNNSHFCCGAIQFEDFGYDPLINFKGAVGFYLDCDTSNSWVDLLIDQVSAKSMLSPVIVAGGNASNRITGIKINQIISDNCYYGFNAQDQGDGVDIDQLIATQNFRPYFVYGCVGHKVKIFNRNNRGGSGAVNISRSPGGLDTKGIDVRYIARDQDQGITHVLINHIDLLGGEISGIKIHVDIESSVVYTPVRFVNYTGSGGAETSAASLNIVSDIILSGSCDAQANPITSVAAYAEKRLLSLLAGSNFNADQTIRDSFFLNPAARNAIPSWTASSVNPAIGNGTLTADYDIVHGVITYSINLIAGSTTTFGTGEWTFSLPFQSKTTAVGSVHVLDSGTAFLTGVCLVNANTSILQCFTNASPGAFNSGNPMTWANGDTLRLSITYPIS